MRPQIARTLQAAAGTLPAMLVVMPPIVCLALIAASSAVGAPGPALDGTAQGLLLRSIRIASTATLLATVCGGTYGWLAARHRLPLRRAFLFASVLPLLLPPYAACLAWTIVLAREGWLNHTLLAWRVIGSPLSYYRNEPLIIGILAGSYWPISAWGAWLAARSVPRELEDSVRLNLADGPAARWAALPALCAGLSAAAVLVFLLAFADFGAPNTVGLATFPVDIVNRFQYVRELAPIVRMAWPWLLAVIPIAALQGWLLERLPAAPAAPDRQRLLGRPGVNALAALAAVLLLIASSGIPLGALAATSLPLDTYADVWAESADHFVNTFASSGGAAVLATALALIYGWHSRARRADLADLALTLPYALPASLIAIALIHLLATGPLAGLDEAIGHALDRIGPSPFVAPLKLWSLIWLYVALFFPFALRIAKPAWASVDPDLLALARLEGASSIAQFRLAAWPAIRGHVVAGAALIAVLASREIDGTALLRVPDGDTLSFRIQDYLHFAPGPKVAALCVIIAAMGAIGAAGIGSLLANRAERERARDS